MQRNFERILISTDEQIRRKASPLQLSPQFPFPYLQGTQVLIQLQISVQPSSVYSLRFFGPFLSPLPWAGPQFHVLIARCSSKVMWWGYWTKNWLNSTIAIQKLEVKPFDRHSSALIWRVFISKLWSLILALSALTSFSEALAEVL